MSRDLAHSIKVVQALENAQYSATINGDIIDAAGLESLTFIGSVGTNFTFTGSNYMTFTVQSDTDSAGGTMAAIESNEYLAPQEDGAAWDRILDAAGDEDSAFSIGVRITTDRYYRIVMTETGTVTAADIGVVAMLGCPRSAPVVA